VVRLYKGGWTCGYAYNAIYIGTFLSIYKGASGCYKVYRGLYIGTSLIFLDLALYISFIFSFSIFILFSVYF
jgi:hypothetical protein